MSSFAAFTHIVFAAAILGLSIVAMIAAIVAVFLRYVVMNDCSMPKTESSAPLPQIGGLAIGGAFLIGISLIQLMGEITPINARYFWGFLASLIVIASPMFFEVFTRPNPKLKIFGQVLAIAIVMGTGIVIAEFHLPYFGLVVGGWGSYLLTFLWILGLTNAYKQTNRLVGLGASTAVIASAFLAFISFQQESIFIYLCSVVLLSAAIGFFIFNFLFTEDYVGEVGSSFLGFSFSVMAIIAGLYDRSHTSMLVVPLLLFHLIFDFVFTSARTITSKNRKPQGGACYLYELLGRVGYSRKKVILIHSIMAASQGLGAIALVNIPGGSRLWIFLPFLLVQTIYACLVVRLAARLG